MSTKSNKKVTHKKITLMKLWVNIFSLVQHDDISLSSPFQLSYKCTYSIVYPLEVFSRCFLTLGIQPSWLNFVFRTSLFSNSVGIINNLCHRVFFHLYWSLVKENCPILLYTCSCPCCGNGSLMDSVGNPLGALGYAGAPFYFHIFEVLFSVVKLRIEAIIHNPKSFEEWTAETSSRWMWKLHQKCIET